MNKIICKMRNQLAFTLCKRANSHCLVFRQLHVSSTTLTETKKEEPETFNIMEELKPPVELSEEEIMVKRNKHRMPVRVYKQFVEKQALPIENEYDFELSRLRLYYGRNGKASGLNPGLQWPTREQLDEIMEHDKFFYRPLQEMLTKVKAERMEKEKAKREYEADVDSKMQNHDKWIKEFFGKINKKDQDSLAMRKKRELLIEEISEYLGYDIDYKDPRFEEAVAQREKEKKKAAKVKRQQESYDKMIAKLKQMADQ